MHENRQKLSNKNKNRNGIVYSTNPDFEFGNKSESNNAIAGDLILLMRFETKHRAGKMVTIISGLKGKPNIEEIAKVLKSKCGTGGSVKDGEILLQGDFRERVKALLLQMGYKVKGG